MYIFKLPVILPVGSRYILTALKNQKILNNSKYNIHVTLTRMTIIQMIHRFPFLIGHGQSAGAWRDPQSGLWDTELICELEDSTVILTRRHSFILVLFPLYPLVPTVCNHTCRCIFKPTKLLLCPELELLNLQTV